MALAVGNAQPGRISGTGVAQPGKISGTGVAQPGRITSVGNINSPSISGAKPVVTDSYLLGQRQLLSENQKYLDAINRLSASQQQTYAPPINWSQINAQARAAATKAVNPLYVKKLNMFLAEQAQKRTQQQQQTQTDISTIEDTLKQRLEQTGIERSRVGEDVAQSLSDIATQSDTFQTDSGQAFEQGREELGQELATSGLGTSGVGRQQVAQATEQQNVTEQRQEKQFQQARAQQQLFKSRSIDDLLRSDELSTIGAEKGKKQAQFDLDNYIKGLSLAEKRERFELEVERKGALLDEESRQTSKLVKSFIDSIKGNAQKQAAYQAYGGFI